MANKYIYGPVPSRRLGLSLGVDIIPYKNCSYDCIYCQLGRTTNKTIMRKEYAPAEEILRETKRYFKNIKSVDYITFSGSGEPTLHSKIGYLIKEIKKITKIPITVLTNGSLLSMPEVRHELAEADIVLPTLCSVNQDFFQKIHRPHREISLESTIRAFIDFRKMYTGKIWLEIMLVKGINDSKSQIMKLITAVEEINPDKIQLNTVIRPPSERYALALSAKELEEIRKLFGQNCETVTSFKEKKDIASIIDNRKKILDVIRRRPVSLNDISNITGLHENEILKYLDHLRKEKKVELNEHHGINYYEATSEGQND